MGRVVTETLWQVRVEYPQADAHYYWEIGHSAREAREIAAVRFNVSLKHVENVMDDNQPVSKTVERAS